MKYAVIDATFGGIALRDGEPDWDTLVGPEGRSHVRLHPSLMSAGWANDCGHLFPETYARNIVGSCLLVAMGASAQPYAGPIVITGWDYLAVLTARWDDFTAGAEISSLQLPEDALLGMHRRVRAAISGAAEPHSLEERDWIREMRDFADFVRHAPAPRLTVLGANERTAA
ncbi:hypothetical protein [Streptomyces vilmorinianum]|uniref:hypothetical protein n=1 Tax=Streptomyces vilmorinianum TaxID=3051092 RepID=UPI0010FB5524|nr:hypothetical protein [Streptomyces vilmorinianum]